MSPDDPLLVSILDGNSLHIFLDDEDDFAMLAETLFTDLDTEDKGKIKKSEIKNALINMGVETGVPPLSGLFIFYFPLSLIFFPFFNYLFLGNTSPRYLVSMDRIVSYTLLQRIICNLVFLPLLLKNFKIFCSIMSTVSFVQHIIFETPLHKLLRGYFEPPLSGTVVHRAIMLVQV